MQAGAWSTEVAVEMGKEGGSDRSSDQKAMH